MVAVALDAVAVYFVGVDAVELGTIAVTTSIATTDSWSVALKAAAVLLLLM